MTEQNKQQMIQYYTKCNLEKKTNGRNAALIHIEREINLTENAKPISSIFQ